MCTHAHTHTRPAALPVRGHKDPALPQESSTGSWTSGLGDVRVRLGRAQTPSPAGDVASHRVSVLMHPAFHRVGDRNGKCRALSLLGCVQDN